MRTTFKNVSFFDLTSDDVGKEASRELLSDFVKHLIILLFL